MTSMKLLDSLDDVIQNSFYDAFPKDSITTRLQISFRFLLETVKNKDSSLLVSFERGPNGLQA